MTIEQLLGHSASQLEAMSDEELTQVLCKYITYTRPQSKEQIAINQQGVTKPKSSKKSSYQDMLDENIRRAKAIAEQFNLKI